MDLQDVLNKTVNYIKERRIGTARRLLKFAYQIDEDDRVISSLVRDTIKDLNCSRFSEACNDTRAIKNVDEREAQFVG